MGRKPDVLIATYFTRGHKLQDASNRYSFTCKGCGAEFPKGRTSHLLDHLVGKLDQCPALSQADFASILAIQASKSAEKAQRIPKRSASFGILGSDSATNDGPQPKKLATELNRSDTNLSGLEALAEASRRVERPVDSRSNEHSITFLNDDLLIDPALSSAPFFPESTHHSSPELSIIAMSASNFEESSSPSRGRSTTDEMPNGPNANKNSPSAEDISEQLSRAAQFPTLIAANPTETNNVEFQNPSTAGGVKHRSKFTEARREEVRNVRSKRACIRCRMLRKPCSPEDPCSRCTSIKNPRIWASRCTRGRLSDVCDLYTAHLNITSIKSNFEHIDASGNGGGSMASLRLCSPNDSELSIETPVTVVVGSSIASTIVVPIRVDDRVNETVRRILRNNTARSLPPELSRCIAYGNRLEAPLELQMFRHAESLYLSSRLLAGINGDIKVSLIHDDTPPELVDQKADMDQSCELALRSVIEYVADQDCYALLRDMEQALVNRTVPASTVLVSAFMLFFCLDLLEYQFRQAGDLAGQDSDATNEGPASATAQAMQTWLNNLYSFSSFMQDLLRCRHVVGEMQINQQGFIGASPTSSPDPTVAAVFTELSINSTLLARSDAEHVAGDPDGLYFKHAARMLLNSQPKGLGIVSLSE